jgi:singapore isolate B (sub-type 7) whole genome shotgun sequence assembly, scaffold_26
MSDSNMENMNTKNYLDEHLHMLLDQLQSLEAVPGLQIESAFHPKTPDRVKLEQPEEGNPDEHEEVTKKEAEGEFA